MPDATTVLGAVDAQDLERLSGLLTENARMVMGNGEPLIGREAIMAANAGFFAMVQGVRHTLLREWVVDGVTVVEAEVTYTRLDGKEVTVPAVSIWEVDEAGLITDYRVLLDQTPLFAG
jgi:ketosteroid isomerase-like protein